MRNWLGAGDCRCWVILYLVNAVLVVNSSLLQGGIERDDITLSSSVMVELSTRQREI
jgi:hypothetical protein